MLTLTTKNPTFFDYFDALDRAFSYPTSFTSTPTASALSNHERRKDSEEIFAQFRTDVEEADNAYTLFAELPGFNKDEIKIDVKEDVLTITATHKKEETSELPTNESSNSDEANETASDETAIATTKEQPIANTVRIIRKERRSCNYKRSFNIDGIEATGIKANYNNGILTVTLPKRTPTEPELIQIDVA